MQDYLIGALIGAALTAGLWLWLLRLKVQAAEQRKELEHQNRLNEERSKLAAEAKAGAEQLAAQKLAEREEQLERRKRGLEDERAELARDRQQAQKEAELAARAEQQAQRASEKAEKRETLLAERESKLDSRTSALDKQEAKLVQRETTVAARDQVLAEGEQALASRQGELDTRLEQVAGLTREEARTQLLERLDQELVAEQSATIAKRTAELETRSKELAVEIIGRAIQRYAAEHSAETTTSKVQIPDDDMKGRIIGKEGRNIRTFEQVTGVDLIIDDTPGIITVSCFDGVRREIARRTLVELMADGRIHPARIEEVLAKVQQDLDREVLKMGEDAAYNVDISGLHPKLLKLLGKLHFRTSYGQNNLVHTQEVAFLCGALAADLGLDPKLGRRCGLMHDIGKALDHEQEGSHPVLGAEALRRYGENEIVQNAALAHHEGQVVTSVYTVLTAAADAISAARPGARRDNAENYLKRLEQIEDIACTFDGVMKAYAIQAGRELRVIVNNHRLTDDALTKTARDIARRIEDEVAYPGEVKVTLIRETRATAVAR